MVQEPEKTDQHGKAEPAGLVLHAWRSPLAIFIFLAICAAALAADLWSKDYVFKKLLADPDFNKDVATLLESHHNLTEKDAAGILRRYSPRIEVIPGVMKITLSTNPGVVFGINWMPRAGVLVATMLTMALVCFFFGSSEQRAWIMHLSLAFIMAGALGNMYDRLFSVVTLPGLPPIKYQVRDFIDCSQVGWAYVFNVADAWLVVGVAGLVIFWFVAERKRHRSHKQSQQA